MYEAYTYRELPWSERNIQILYDYGLQVFNKLQNTINIEPETNRLPLDQFEIQSTDLSLNRIDPTYPTTERKQSDLSLYAEEDVVKIRLETTKSTGHPTSLAEANELDLDIIRRTVETLTLSPALLARKNVSVEIITEQYDAKKNIIAPRKESFEIPFAQIGDFFSYSLDKLKILLVNKLAMVLDSYSLAVLLNFDGPEASFTEEEILFLKTMALRHLADKIDSQYVKSQAEVEVYKYGPHSDEDLLKERTEGPRVLYSGTVTEVRSGTIIHEKIFLIRAFMDFLANFIDVDDDGHTEIDGLAITAVQDGLEIPSDEIASAYEISKRVNKIRIALTEEEFQKRVTTQIKKLQADLHEESDNAEGWYKGIKVTSESSPLTTHFYSSEDRSSFDPTALEIMSKVDSIDELVLLLSLSA